jgi:hypothetical protein
MMERPRPINVDRKSTVQQAAAVTTDMTRRMICGGLAGMIAKVRQKRCNGRKASLCQ